MTDVIDKETIRKLIEAEREATGNWAYAFGGSATSVTSSRAMELMRARETARDAVNQALKKEEAPVENTARPKVNEDEILLSSPVAHLRRQSPIYQAIQRAETFLHDLMNGPSAHYKLAGEIHEELHDAAYLYVISGQNIGSDSIRAELVESLRLDAHSVSRASKILAENKSLRQGDCDPPRADLYDWVKPEQTLQWRAADAIEAAYAREDIAQRIKKIADDIDYAVAGGMAWIDHSEAADFSSRLRRIVSEMTPPEPVSQPAD